MKRIVVRLSYRVEERFGRRMHRMRDGRLRLRYQIVLLWSDGRSSGEIAAALRCAVSTAIFWAHRFLAGGEAGLVDRRSENGPKKVDLDLLQAVAEGLHFLPPYCPFENRIEMLWKQLPTSDTNTPYHGRTA